MTGRLDVSLRLDIPVRMSSRFLRRLFHLKSVTRGNRAILDSLVGNTHPVLRSQRARLGFLE